MNNKRKKITDLIIKIVLIIIIIILLIHNCELIRKNKEYANSPVPSGNIDIIEIKCDNNGCKPTLKEIESLSFGQEKISVKKGDTLTLIAIIKPSELSGSKLTWKSSDTNIVTVDSDGRIKGINTGKATITVTSQNGKTATCIVEVINDSVDVKKINLIPEKKEINVGSSTQINAQIEPSNATNRDLVWTSSNSEIATVDSKGFVKGIKNGTVTITAKTKDGKVVASTTITINSVTREVESLRFSQDNVNIKKGDSFGLTVIVTPTELSGSKFTWKSSDTNIVTVDSSGRIKGINTGRATITVTSQNGKTATCTVEVINDEIKVEEIVLTPIDNVIGTGNVTQIIAEIKPKNATNRELIWTSSNSEIATVDANGTVNGIKNGTVTITAKTKDGKIVASTTIIVSKDNAEFAVYDKDHTTLTWNGSNDINIFEKSLNTVNGKIAPESSNTYQFIVKNSTKYNLKYNIVFEESNPYHINMKYKLKKNDTYLIDHYVSASELNVSELLLNSNSNDTYYLEWKWVSSDNDTEIGKTANATYGLKIELKAESVND